MTLFEEEWFSSHSTAMHDTIFRAFGVDPATVDGDHHVYTEVYWDGKIWKVSWIGEEIGILLDGRGQPLCYVKVRSVEDEDWENEAS